MGHCGFEKTYQGVFASYWFPSLRKKIYNHIDTQLYLPYSTTYSTTLLFMRDFHVKTGQSTKLKPRYKGPYMITKMLDKNRYVVQDIPDFNVSSKP
ncbi:hypothetical protein ACFW04_013986 [Cataglyphis niger]